jgi:hypothetical protein
MYQSLITLSVHGAADKEQESEANDTLDIAAQIVLLVIYLFSQRFQYHTKRVAP